MNYIKNSEDIYVAVDGVHHRDDEYPENGFIFLVEMQDRHFWYLGRHKLLQNRLKKHFKNSFSCIDLGGGCGGWVNYLDRNSSENVIDLALFDSSLVALRFAKSRISGKVDCFHGDLMKINLSKKWDAVFLLDVIEHCPNDAEIIKQASSLLSDRGKLFITVPAFNFFWSQTDVAAKHLRRYTISDFNRLSQECNLTLIESRYFMFLLSPFMLLYRKLSIRVGDSSRISFSINGQYKVPNKLLNYIFTKLTILEVWLSNFLHLPFGTSVLCIFEKMK